MMGAPVTTVFHGNHANFGKIKKKIVRGIVRHYATPKILHRPYQGILNEPTDLSKHEIKSLQQLLEDFPDGEKIEIVVTSQGESHSAHGFVWMLTEPHVYERVPLKEWKKTLPKEAKPYAERYQGMNAEEYGQLKQSLIDIVPRNCIAINLPKKLVLRAPNGTFIKVGHMEMDPYLLEESPQMTIDLLHNKLLIQWTDDIDADTYENIGAEILGKQAFKDSQAEEAIAWLSALYDIREAFGIA